MAKQIDMDEWNDETWSQRAKNFRFFFHFVLVGLPYLVIDVFFQMMNLLTNMFANKFWGDLNWILIYNTGVSLF